MVSEGKYIYVPKALHSEGKIWAM